MTRNQITFAVLCFLAILSLVMMAPAFAQGVPLNCGKHDKFIEAFKDKFNETGSALGIANDTILVELYLAPDGATWTILSTRPDGISCIIAAGKDWMSKPAEILGKES